MVEEPEQERAGFLMLLSLVFGLLAGSTMAFAVLAVLCDCNSFLGAKVNTTDGPGGGGGNFTVLDDLYY